MYGPCTISSPAHSIKKQQQYKKQHLALCHRILAGEPVRLDGTPIQATLLLSGLAIGKEGHLQIANEIYRQIFQQLL